VQLRYEPLLQAQRDFYQRPRGSERFREHLRLMLTPNGDDRPLSLLAIDSLGADHLPHRLDALLALDADGVAGAAVAEAEAALADEPGRYVVAVAMGDDLLGASQSANRYRAEMAARFRQKACYTRGSIFTVLWTSEDYTVDRLRQEVWSAILRASYVQRHGYARTLHEMLAQEGCVLRGAGAAVPCLAPDDLDYTRAVLEPYRDRSDEPVLIAALFGDRAAHALGYPPLGLSADAGLALALAETS
jgi:hypothetical protein